MADQGRERQKPTQECVWVSEAFANTRIFSNLRFIYHGRFMEELSEEEQQTIVSITERYHQGGELSVHERMNAFCPRFVDSKIQKFPDFFYANGFLIVSECCAEVLRQFDLGRGGLSPVEIYEFDRTTKIPQGPFFLLTFGSTKDTLMLEKSTPNSLEKVGRVKPLWSTWRAQNDDCALSSAALAGPDLWFEKRIHWAFFLSDKLAQALKAAKVNRNFEMKRCRVVF